jgi:hypothetical protein
MTGAARAVNRLQRSSSKRAFLRVRRRPRPVLVRRAGPHALRFTVTLALFPLLRVATKKATEILPSPQSSYVCVTDELFDVQFLHEVDSAC